MAKVLLTTSTFHCSSLY